MRVPDIVCWRRDVSFVIDVQVSEETNIITLRDTHLLKVQKYNIPEVTSYARERMGVDQALVVSPPTVSWRGILAPQSERLLHQLGLLKNMVELIPVRTSSGSTSVYANYMGTSGGADVTQGVWHRCMLDAPPGAQDLSTQLSGNRTTGLPRYPTHRLLSIRMAGRGIDALQLGGRKRLKKKKKKKKYIVHGCLSTRESQV